MQSQPTTATVTQNVQGNLFVQLPQQLPIFKHGPEDEPEETPVQH